MSIASKDWLAAFAACVIGAFIAFFPAWLIGGHIMRDAPTAAAAVAKPNFAARDALAYALIELGYTCRVRGISEQDCKTVYDRSAAEARR